MPEEGIGAVPILHGASVHQRLICICPIQEESRLGLHEGPLHGDLKHGRNGGLVDAVGVWQRTLVECKLVENQGRK